MQVNFTPEQEADLLQIARHWEMNSEQLVKDAALRMVEEDRQFRTAVQRGLEQADRGELLPHGEVFARVERLLKR